MLTRSGLDLLDVRGPIAPWEYPYFLHAARMHEIKDEMRAMRIGKWSVQDKHSASRWNDEYRKLSSEYNRIMITFQPDRKKQDSAWSFLRGTGGRKGGV